MVGKTASAAGLRLMVPSPIRMGLCTWGGRWRGSARAPCWSLPPRHPRDAVAAGWGRLYPRAQTPALSLRPLSPLAGTHPSPSVPEASRRRAPRCRCLPGGSDTTAFPWEEKMCLSEVRRTQCHSSYRMATIARETELSTAPRWASPSGNFIEARTVPNSLRLRPCRAFPARFSAISTAQAGQVPGAPHLHRRFIKRSEIPAKRRCGVSPAAQACVGPTAAPAPAACQRWVLGCFARGRRRR